MEIPRSLLSELTEAVNALSTSAQALAATALDEIFKEWDGSDVTGLRVKCIEALEAIESVYCDTYAAGRAAEFYEGCRAAQGVRGAYSAIADSRRDPQALAGAVRAMIQYVVNGETDRYRRECLSRIDADVRRSANSCVAYNTRRDPKKPRYARVPTGGETCGFCLMLSSFGFHYTTEEAAGHAHDGCDCRVVPSFGKASVKGYDSDGMYSRYQDVLETLGGRDGIRAEWDALPKEEREAYIASHGKKEGAAFQKYMNKRVSQEIEANGAEWFATGINVDALDTSDFNKAAVRASFQMEAKTSDKVLKALDGYEIAAPKLEKYALSPDGDANKARAFSGYLGYSASDSAEVAANVYAYVADHAPEYRDSTPYGDRCTTEMVMMGKDGKSAKVKVGWIKDKDTGKMRLTTIFVDE